MVAVMVCRMDEQLAALRAWLWVVRRVSWMDGSRAVKMAAKWELKRAALKVDCLVVLWAHSLVSSVVVSLDGQTAGL